MYVCSSKLLLASMSKVCAKDSAKNYEDALGFSRSLQRKTQDEKDEPKFVSVTTLPMEVVVSE